MGLSGERSAEAAVIGNTLGSGRRSTEEKVAEITLGLSCGRSVETAVTGNT